jgi:hypothetical protein
MLDLGDGCPSPRIADYKKEGIITLVKARGGWLTVFFVGLVLAAVVVERFEDLLTAEVELSYFVPLLIGRVAARLVTWTILPVIDWRCPPYALLGLLQGITPGCQVGYVDHTGRHRLMFDSKRTRGRVPTQYGHVTNLAPCPSATAATRARSPWRRSSAPWWGPRTSQIQFDPQLETARLQPLSLPLDPS